MRREEIDFLFAVICWFFLNLSTLIIEGQHVLLQMLQNNCLFPHIQPIILTELPRDLCNVVVWAQSYAANSLWVDSNQSLQENTLRRIIQEDMVTL